MPPRVKEVPGRGHTCVHHKRIPIYADARRHAQKGRMRVRLRARFAGFEGAASLAYGAVETREAMGIQQAIKREKGGINEKFLQKVGCQRYR